MTNASAFSRSTSVGQNVLDILLEVTDLLGTVLFSTTIPYKTGEHFVPLNIDGLANGSYLCRMLVNGKPVGSVGFVVGR